MAVRIQELKTLIENKEIKQAIQILKENAEEIKRYKPPQTMSRKLLLTLQGDVEELTPLWRMETNTCDSYIQWVPREILDVINELSFSVFDLIELLVKYNVVDLHLIFDEGSGFLSCHNKVFIVSLLLERGADVNAKNQSGASLLHVAVRAKHVEVACLLLGRGADVNAKNHLGATPLHVAALNGHVQIVRLLLEKGADVNAKNQFGATPLHVAAKSGCVEMVCLLLEKGANLNAQNKEGKTALDITIELDDVQLTALLQNPTPQQRGVRQLSSSRYLIFRESNNAPGLSNGSEPSQQVKFSPAGSK